MADSESKMLCSLSATKLNSSILKPDGEEYSTKYSKKNRMRHGKTVFRGELDLATRDSQLLKCNRREGRFPKKGDADHALLTQNESDCPKLSLVSVPDQRE